MKKQILIVAALLCHANPVWAEQVPGEQMIHFTDSVIPVWPATGFYLEVSGQFVKTTPGEASVVMRLLDNARPLVVTYDSAEGGGWTLVRQGDLPRDLADNTTPGGEKTVTWRIHVRKVQQSVQKIVLSELRAGTWEVVISQDLALQGLWEWVANQSIVTFGIAGPLVLENPRVRVRREPTLFLVR